MLALLTCRQRVPITVLSRLRMFAIALAIFTRFSFKVAKATSCSDPRKTSDHLQPYEAWLTQLLALLTAQC